MSNTFPASGNVGCGTTSPNFPLQVVGCAAISDPTFTGELEIYFSANGQVTFYLQGSPGIGGFLQVGGASLGNTVSFMSNAIQATSPFYNYIGLLNLSAGGTYGAGKVLTSDASGNATWQTPSGSGTSGTYNPTVSSSSNITAYSVYGGTWMQIGNWVHVIIRFSAQATVNNTSTQITFSLPKTTSNGNQSDVGMGLIYIQNLNEAGIVAISSTTTCNFTYMSTSTSGQPSGVITFDYTL